MSRIGHVHCTSSYGDAYHHTRGEVRDDDEKRNGLRGTLDMLEGAMASEAQWVKDNCCAMSPEPGPVEPSETDAPQ